MATTGGGKDRTHILSGWNYAWRPYEALLKIVDREDCMTSIIRLRTLLTSERSSAHESRVPCNVTVGRPFLHRNPESGKLLIAMAASRTKSKTSVSHIHLVTVAVST
jgi:hypothetical protein